jgi:hypothetical protein
MLAGLLQSKPENIIRPTCRVIATGFKACQCQGVCDPEHGTIQWQTQSVMQCLSVFHCKQSNLKVKTHWQTKICKWEHMRKAPETDHGHMTQNSKQSVR